MVVLHVLAGLFFPCVVLGVWALSEQVKVMTSDLFNSGYQYKILLFFSVAEISVIFQ